MEVFQQRARESRHQCSNQLLTTESLLAVQMPFSSVTRMVCFLALVSASASMAAEDIWDSAPFTVEAHQLLQAAHGVPVQKNPGVTVLLQEQRFRVESDNRVVRTRYSIMRLDSTDSIQLFSAIEVPWQPWFQDQPRVRARVITPDGQVHVLDQALLHDAPAIPLNPLIYSDLRLFGGPLPAVEVGAVLELEEIVRDKAPMFEAGVVEEALLQALAPVHKSRIVVDHPAGSPFKYEVEGVTGARTTVAKSGDREILSIEVNDLPAKQQIPLYLPTDHPTFPEVKFATGTSWGDIAKRYASSINSRIRPEEVKTFVANIPGASPNRKQTERIDAIIGALQSKVRYTGVEFGQATFIPQPPSVVLAHQYGDCKDKAALLVSLLREAGIPAYLALLRAGTGEDIAESLPGFGEFNHAIVYIPGTPDDHWIDATVEHARASVLPSVDQGRFALVISDDTSSLKKTPVASASENILVYKIKVNLAEYKLAKASFQIQPGGSFDETYRELATLDAKERKDVLAKIVSTILGTEQFADLTHSDPVDLGRPFELSMSVPHVSWGSTDFNTSVLWIPQPPIQKWLPPQFTTEFSAKNQADQRRSVDVEIPEAFAREWEYEIVPPDGYSAAELPADKDLELGSASLSQRYKKNGDGTVLATVRFEVPNRRFTADQARELTSKTEELEKDKFVAIKFNNTASMLLSQGKIKEAIAEYRRLVNLHPKEALHHVALSGAFLQAGLGESARAEAKEAVSLEPNSSMAWGALGDSLAYDLLGRAYKPGFERQKAIDAYEKSLTLDPDNGPALVNEAVLYYLDDKGDTTSSLESLDKAIALFRRAEKLDHKPRGTDDDFLLALFFANQYTEVAKQATALGLLSSRLAFVIAAIALSDNPERAIEFARNNEANEQARSRALSGASELLVRKRAYKQAAALTRAVTDVNSDSSAALRLQALERVKPYQETLFPDSDPRSAIQQLYLTVYGKSQTKSVIELFSNLVLAGQDGAKLEADIVRSIGRASLSKGFDEKSDDVVLDWLFSNFRYVVDGDDQTGYRIRIDRDGGDRRTAFLVRDDSKWKFVEFGHSVAPPGLVALEAIQKGNLVKALQWINWGRDEAAVTGGDDPLAGQVFPRIWTKGEDASRETAEMVASVMVSGSQWSASVVANLERELTAYKAQEMQMRIRQALCSAFFRMREWEQLAQCSEPLLEWQPGSATAFNYLANAYIHLQRWNDLNAIAQTRLSRDHEDATAPRMFARAAMERGDFAGARATLKKIIDQPNSNSTLMANDLNSYAWLAMFVERVDSDAIMAAQKANSLANGRNSAILHTLACLLAAEGDVRETRNYLLAAMDVAHLAQPEDTIWFGVGLIAEQYGETNAARLDYERVSAPKQTDAIAESTWTLAQHRLKVLQQDVDRSKTVATRN